MSETATPETNAAANGPADQTPECGWVKLYHPRGPLVTIPVTAGPLDYGAMLTNVSAMLDVGWLTVAPGLDPGEQKFDVGYVVRRIKDNNNDGTSSDVIDLYPADEGLKWPEMHVYLDDQADIDAFEFASGLSVAALPEHIGKDRIERGASRRTDPLIVKAPRPFGVVWKANPKHDPNETDVKKKKPKKMFVRWENQRPATAAAPPQGGPNGSTGSTGSQNGSQPNQGQSKGLPATGLELVDRLKVYEGKLVSQCLCNQGDLLAFVLGEGVKKNHPADLAKWTAPAIALAADATKAFEAQARERAAGSGPGGGGDQPF